MITTTPQYLYRHNIIHEINYSNFKARRIRERLKQFILKCFFLFLITLDIQNLSIKAEQSSPTPFNLNPKNELYKEPKKTGYKKKKPWYEDKDENLLSSTLSTTSPLSSIYSALKMNIESKMIDDALEEEGYDIGDDYDEEYLDGDGYDDLLYDKDDDYLEEEELKEENIKEPLGKRKNILQSWISSQILIKPFNAREDDKKNISSKMLMVISPEVEDVDSSPSTISKEGSKEITVEDEKEEESQYCSSGYWETIDKISSLGLSSSNPNYKISKKLRTFRKKTASITGLHGILSGKQHQEETTAIIEEEKLGMIRRRLLAIERARERIKENIAVSNEQQQQRRRGHRWRAILSKSIQAATNLRKEMLLDITPALSTSDEESDNDQTSDNDHIFTKKKIKTLSKEEIIKQNKRIKEINVLIENNQRMIQILQTEKDYLSNHYNPLFNYTKHDDSNKTRQEKKREFDFPCNEIVEDYINNLINQGRLSRMNHTFLWRESIDGDTFTERFNTSDSSNGNSNTAVTSWILRQTIIGSGRNRVTIGEKISDIVEISTYKAVCSSLMSILARSIASLHGQNIMEHADICLHVIKQSQKNVKNTNLIIQEVQDDNVNTNQDDDINDNQTDKEVIQAKKKKRKKKKRIKNTNENKQQMLFVETFLSHVQTAAPIFKLFPIVWQRSFIHNLLRLVISIVEDFTKGVKLHILGYELSLLFQPSNVDSSDGDANEYTSFLLNNFFSSSSFITQNITTPFVSKNDNDSTLFSKEDFETIVQRIGVDLSNRLQFLDRWHERVLGGQILRDQVGMVISRIVMLIMEDVLRSLDVDLWSSARISASLNYLL